MKFDIANIYDIDDSIAAAWYIFEGKNKRAPEVILMNPETAIDFQRQIHHMELNTTAINGYLEFTYRGKMIYETHQLRTHQIELY